MLLSIGHWSWTGVIEQNFHHSNLSFVVCVVNWAVVSMIGSVHDTAYGSPRDFLYQRLPQCPRQYPCLKTCAINSPKLMCFSFIKRSFFFQNLKLLKIISSKNSFLRKTKNKRRGRQESRRSKAPALNIPTQPTLSHKIFHKSWWAWL